MMFLHSLTNWLRKPFAAKTNQTRPSTRLRLEALEDRVVPAEVSPISTSTYTNATVQITPGFTVTETITATVTPFQGYDRSTGQITPIPSGATAPSNGTVLFGLGGQTKTATLNSSGQASATFQVPLLAFLTSQGAEVSYLGYTDTSTENSWEPSSFSAVLYKNWLNVLLPSTLTFNQLTPQQVYAIQISAFQNPSGYPTTLGASNTANGETDTIGNGLVAFNYSDPGTIDTVTALGMQLPGVVAIQLGAYSGIPAQSSSK